MLRNIKSASSSSSETTSSPKHYTSREFSVWSMVRRSIDENAFCLTSKYRINAKIHRISYATVTRMRRDIDDKDDVDNDSDASSSSEISQDLEHCDNEDEDLEGLYDMVTQQPNMKAASGSILAITKMMAFRRENSADLNAIVIEEIGKTGTRAQKLYLKKCDEFRSAFCKRFLYSLNTSSASISHQYVGDKGIEACIIALTQTSVVTVLNLTNNNIGYKGAKYIAMLLKDNKTITDLNVSDNKIALRGATYLTEVIGDTDRLKRFDISNNSLREKDAYIFKLMLEETRNLKYLNLSQNGFREEGGVILGDALSYNDGLEELDLSWNHLRRKGSDGLAEGLLDNTSLKTLNLSWNGFFLEGCRVLERTLVHNSTLLTLDLTNNRINRECIDHLSRGLAKNRTLHTLILKLNPLTSDGAYDILQFLNECTSSGIKVLDLGMQQVDAGFEHLLTEIKMQRRSIDVIYGLVIGRRTSVDPEQERSILKEHSALILIEYANLMGFRLIDLFASLDRTGTRSIEKEELILGLKIAGIPLADAAIKKLVAKLDFNKDGLINIREVLTAEKEHADQMVQLKEAQEEMDGQKMNSIPIWRIRSSLRKLVVEKLTDFNLFKKVSEQLTKQINSVVDAKNKELDEEEERKRLKRNRSLSIPGNDIPTTKRKHLRQIHAQKSTEWNDGTCDLDEVSVAENVTFGTSTNNHANQENPSSFTKDVSKIKTETPFRKGVKTHGWTLEPQMESDSLEPCQPIGTVKDDMIRTHSTFSRISDRIQVTKEKASEARHCAETYDEGREDDEENAVDEEYCDLSDDSDGGTTVVTNKTSKTSRRNSIGTLKLGSNGDKILKR